MITKYCSYVNDLKYKFVKIIHLFLISIEGGCACPNLVIYQLTDVKSENYGQEPGVCVWSDKIIFHNVSLTRTPGIASQA